MGSGHFASEGYGKAAFISSIQIVDKNTKLVTPNEHKVLVGSSDLRKYTVDGYGVSKDGMHMYYGGPATATHLQVQQQQKKPTITRPNATRFSTQIKTTPYLKELQRHLTVRLGEASDAMSNAYKALLDAFVESTFTFSDQLLRPTESNFAPVDEVGERIKIMEIEVTIPADFPEGVYIRNGSNPLFGALHTVSSIFGQTEDIWVEEKACSTPSTSAGAASTVPPPVTKGNRLAMLAASLLNMLRFGKVMRSMSNTSVFMHAGRVFAAAENDIPHELNLQSLDTIASWSIGGDWILPFTAPEGTCQIQSHLVRFKLKVVPESGELVISGINIMKPYLTIGLVSEDGMKLEQMVDLKLDRCTFCHEIGITKMYNIIMDMPLTLSASRILRAAPLMEYEKESYARIGVMPRNGDAESVIWFDVEPFCTMHLVNCFEEGDEVVVRGFRVPASIIMGPMLQHNKVSGDQEMNEEYFSRLYEWRLNLKSKAVAGEWLTGTDVAMEFPVINDKYVGLHHRYAYAQVVNVEGSMAGGCGTVRPKFGGFAKLYLDQEIKESCGDSIHVEYHHLETNQFCSGAIFVAKADALHEDDGWIISFVHDEGTNISQAHIIDARRFESGPVAKITLPQRVPYGFHGAFVSKT
ncbi:hypothetical protein ZWY2020_026686 [Hordeum vulgare]|nr:hypothetical protein ZWY2020_026686 [Hordeum vulgare]